jgi:phosphoglucosamine mutase
MSNLFGTDGIRGIVGEWPLVPEFCLKLGQAAGSVLRDNFHQPTIVVGRDTRSSGPMLQSALVAGLLFGGVNVINAEVIPTSGVAWLLRRLGAEAGAVISASHNPVEQNGVKFFNEMGQKMTEALEDEIEQRLLANVDSPGRISPVNQPGRLTSGDTLHGLYIEGLLAEHPALFMKPITLVMDCSNGAASYLGPEVLTRAGARVIAVHASPTGSNINDRSGSEHVRRAPGELGELVRYFKADFGMAFDGDADRVVFVDEEDNLVDGDHMLGFLAHYLHQKNLLLADSVVTTNMRNSGLKAYLQSIGLNVHETPVGDKYVVDKLLEIRGGHDNEKGKLGLGGEQAGHIDLINDEFTTGDGIRTALFVIRSYLETGARSMSSFAQRIGKTPQIIASAFVGNGPKIEKEKLNRIEKCMMDDYAGLERVNLRYSGTEPLFRAMLESNGSQNEDDLASIALGLCQRVQAYAGVDDGCIDVLNCTKGGVLKPTVDHFHNNLLDE